MGFVRIRMRPLCEFEAQPDLLGRLRTVVQKRRRAPALRHEASKRSETHEASHTQRSKNVRFSGAIRPDQRGYPTELEVDGAQRSKALDRDSRHGLGGLGVAHGR